MLIINHQQINNNHNIIFLHSKVIILKAKDNHNYHLNYMFWINKYNKKNMNSIQNKINMKNRNKLKIKINLNNKYNNKMKIKLNNSIKKN